MKIAKILSIIGLLAMTVILIYGITIGEFGREGANLLSMPWGIVSLVDLYVGFVLFSIWIAYRESSTLSAFAWIIGMMVLGFWTGSIYMLINLFRSEGDWKKFWLGKNV